MFGVKLLYLVTEQGLIITSGQSNYLKLVWERPDNVQGLASDGPS